MTSLRHFFTSLTLAVLALAPARGALAADGTRPWTFWYWMYGAVSEAGIKADLQCMKDAGLGGCYLMPIRGSSEYSPLMPAFDGEMAHQLTPRFWQVVDYAMQQADSLGLDMGIHICDGFALAGGPWITPEESMQRVIWTDTIINIARATRAVALPKAASGYHKRESEPYYRDIAAFAVPVTGEASLPRPVVGGTVTPSAASPAYNVTNKESHLDFDYGRPVTVRRVEVVPSGNNVQSQRLLVQASDDGLSWRNVRQLAPPRQGWQNTDANYTYSLPATTARHFRFLWTPGGTEPGAEDLDAAKWNNVLKLAAVNLGTQPVVDQYESKNGCVWRIAAPCPADCTPATEGAPVPVSLAGGQADRPLPPGTYRILRLGHTATGHTNATGGGAKGLECDKFSAEAVDKQTDHWFGLFMQRPHSRVVKFMHVDSWECGSQNWSRHFAAEFKARRGYDLMPFTAVYAGVPIDAMPQAKALGLSSDRVLSDIRQTINDLLQERFFATVSRRARQYGVQLSCESVAPTMVSDGMEHFKYADVPMGEYWLNSPTHDKPNDMLDAISAAHVYGKPVVQAEAFTEVRGVWDETPATIKRLLDRHLALGVNRLFFHVFTHNPFTDRRPGMTLDGIGLFFQRDQTWMGEARALTDYIARCQQLLQRGEPVVDIAVYTGEEMPRRALTPDKLVATLPGLFGQERIEQEKRRHSDDGTSLVESPVGVRHRDGIFSLQGWANALHGYHYDSMNRDALLHRPFSYRVLVVPQGMPVSAQVQARIDELRRQGVVIVDEPFLGNAFEGLPPDMTATKGNDRHLGFAHRRDAATNTDIYFVCNDQEDRSADGFLSFRAEGRPSVIYDPLDDRYYPSQAIMANGRMNVPYKLRAGESMFVIFADSVPPTTAMTGGEELAIKGPWHLRFTENGKELRNQDLFDWSKNTDEGIRFYSGRVSYSTSFDFQPTAGAAPAMASLELGRVCDVAHVWLNGVDCGTAWTPPYSVDVARALRKGKNELVVEVVNTWNNALRGADLKKPPFDGIWTNAKYRRKERWTGDENLLPAGLLGQKDGFEPPFVKLKTYYSQ